MGRSRKRGPNATGRNANAVGRTGRFMAVRHAVLWSPQVAALSPLARVLMIELGSMYDGQNNGAIYLSQRDAAARCGVTDTKAIKAAFAELKSVGLVSISLASSFSMKAGGKGRAQAFRLHFIDDGGWTASKLPDVDYSKMSTIRRKRLADRMRVLATYRKERANITVEDSTTLSSRTELAVVDSTPSPENLSLEASNWEQGDSSTHIIYHRERERCAHCTSLFERARSNQSYCSPVCRRKAERAKAAMAAKPGWWASIQPILDRPRAANEDERLKKAA